MKWSFRCEVLAWAKYWQLDILMGNMMQLQRALKSICLHVPLQPRLVQLHHLEALGHESCSSLEVHGRVEILCVDVWQCVRYEI